MWTLGVPDVYLAELPVPPLFACESAANGRCTIALKRVYGAVAFTVRIRVQFVIRNLELWSDVADFDTVSFLRLQDYDRSIRKVKSDHEVADTALARIDQDVSDFLDFSSTLDVATSILRPYLLLLSLAQGCWITWRVRAVFKGQQETPAAIEQARLPFTRPHPSDLIWLPHQEDFLRKTYPMISRKDFLERTGFAIGLSWYLRALEQDFEETDFLLSYIALESLAWAHVKHLFSTVPSRLREFEKSPRAKIKRFLTDKHCPTSSFFPDPDEDLHALRNHIAHRGMAFERRRPGPFGKQILQIRALLDWLFLTLLEYQGPYRDISHRGAHRDFPFDVGKLQGA